jgi:extracellular factor (EF) 3-hydroxypalmitic acid methyl ester biosynthesis protein
LDAWADRYGLLPGRGLRAEAEHFIHDWEVSNHLRPSYQVIVSSIGNLLTELSKWIEEAEAGIFNGDNPEETPMKQAFFEEVAEPVLPKIIELHEIFEEEARQIPPEEVAAHKSFARRIIHPLTMCAPFVHRTFTKPLGYTGDYEMVNMLLRESPDTGSSTYAKIVQEYNIFTGAPAAHRNRIDMLEERLKNETLRVIEEARPFTVLNVGCGPALEVQRFIRKEDLARYGMFGLMDFNEETIEYAKKMIQNAINESGHKPMVKFIHKSIDSLLKEALDNPDKARPSYEMIYSAGLFDYLTGRTCKHLVELFYSWLRPGGLLTVTNVHPKNFCRYSMEHFLEWHLIYRDENEMEALAPPDVEKEIVTDATGLNVFLDIRKQR